jgi:hypothetical protein
MADNIIMTQQNTVYARRARGFKSFKWGGKCMMIDESEKELGDLNPSLRQGVNGGVEVGGVLRGTPGLGSTTLTAKEQQMKHLIERMEKGCFFDVDRRTHCRDMPAWSAWDKIRRHAYGRATSKTFSGSTYEEDEEESVVSLPWSAQDDCVIRRIALSTQTFGTASS